MELRSLNSVCFGICILCIVLGMTLSLVMLWTDGISSPVTWKVAATLGVVFVASAATLSVNRMVDGRK